MSTPEISVVVCNYNHAQYISGAVKSILEQSFSNFEIIIADDGSTDNSKDIIESLIKLDTRIQKPIYLEQNKGKWFALNTAIASAKGKLITLQDADDSSHPERLLRQYDVLTANNSYHNLCGFKHCYSQYDIENGQQTKLPTAKAVMNHKDVLLKVYQGKKTPGINHYFVGHDYEVHGASCLFHKSLWENGIKFLPGNLGLRVQKAEDSDFNTKMTLLLQKTSVLREPLYLYRRNTSTNGAWLENL
jgi:glycosyltransferase involved in cell wall biosynthesis